MSAFDDESFHLPDSAWQRVAPLIARTDPSVDAHGRAHLDGMLTRVLIGRAWQELEQEAPGWAAVHTTYNRWEQLGLLDELSRTLLVRLDD